MATFDFARLDPALYNPDDPVGANALQTMVEDFMEVVRTNPASLTDKIPEMTRFCAIIAHDKAWGLAVRVVPELRRPQDYPTPEATAMNVILRSVVHKRPRPRVDDPKNHQEKESLGKQIREAVRCIETGGRPDQATAKEEQDVEDLMERVNRIISGYLGVSV